MINKGQGGNVLGRVLIDIIREEGRNPDALELATLQQDMSLLTDKFTVPLPAGEYLVCKRLFPISPGDRVLIAWVNDHTDAVIIDIIVSS